MPQTDKDKLLLQNNVEKISADSAGEPKPSASSQRDDGTQRNAGHPLTSDTSESHKQPTTETLLETDDIAAGV